MATILPLHRPPPGDGGHLVNDAHLAALASEHRCGIVSFDNDFSRLDGVRWSQLGG